LGRLAHLLDAFPGQLNKTLVVTLNAVGTKTKSRAVKTLAARYAIKPVEFRHKILMDKAHANDMRVRVRGAGRPILLNKFDHKTVKVDTDRGPRVGVKARVLKSSGLTMLTGGASGAFIGVAKNNETGEKLSHSVMYERLGKRHNPLTALYGPSLIKWFENPENIGPLEEFAAGQIQNTLTAIATHHLKKLGLAL
jgi:hypothetical protein